MNLKRLFLDHCKMKAFEVNDNQIATIKAINEFYQKNFDYNFLLNLFSKKKKIFRLLLTG